MFNKRRFQNQKVYITTVHRVYSRARSQVRLNGTRWATLEEFCAYLAKTGKAEVFETDKGPKVYIQERMLNTKGKLVLHEILTFSEYRKKEKL